ncbi:phospholipase D-like domain-containing protein [Bacillus sp. JJ664]
MLSLLEFLDKQKNNNLLRVEIATAYYSKEGLDHLKQIVSNSKLEKHQVILYLSEDFSNNKPSFLLEETIKLATVRLVQGRLLHAKLYLFIDKIGNYSYSIGSSNFTNGGLSLNLELNSIYEDCEREEIEFIKSFLDECNRLCVEVDYDVIKHYKEIEEVLYAAAEESKKIRKDIRFYNKENDPFTIETFNLSNSIFTFEEYEALFPRNQSSKSQQIQSLRQSIQRKLLSIHNVMFKKLKILDLHPHWDKAFITSQITPINNNHHRVSWIGVRFGKQKKQIKFRDDDAFYKHGNLQFVVVPKGFEIAFYHSIPGDGFDKAIVHEKLLNNDQEWKKSVIEEIRKLKGNGYSWVFHNLRDQKDIDVFNIDTRDPEDFFNFYKKHCYDELESYCYKTISPNSKYLTELKVLSEYIEGEFIKLLPLYKEMTYRLPF